MRKTLGELRGHWHVILLVALTFFIFAFVSIEKHRQFRSNAWDLAIFDQAIWHYSRFEAPASTVRGVDNLLADHIHPILVTFVTHRCPKVLG